MGFNDMDQGLLQRNPAMTPQQFSQHWFTKHAPLVVPMFLHSGIQHYQQTHGPLTPTYSSPREGAAGLEDLAHQYDGAVFLPPQEALDHPAVPMPRWKQAYYDEVVKVDERRFLVAEALEHVRKVPPRSFTGEVKIVIKEGKCLIDVPEEVWEVWRAYEKRGEGEDDSGDGK